jgi:hypothetical protein
MDVQGSLKNKELYYSNLWRRGQEEAKRAAAGLPVA